MAAPDLPEGATFDDVAVTVSPGLPVHEDEVMASHPGRPTSAEATARGVTPASGAGHGGQ